MSDVELAQRVRALEVERTRRPELLRRRLSIYVLATNQTISNNNLSFETINYDAVEYDPYGLVTPGAGWIWTAPFPGRVWGHAKMMFASTASWADGDAGEIDLHKNGSKYTVIDRKDNHPANTFMRLGDSFSLMVAAGDTLAIKAYQNSGTVGGLAIYNLSFGFNRVEIELIG